MDELHRELRVRYGYEKNADAYNRTSIETYEKAINKHVDSYTDQLGKLREEQIRELERKYRSDVAKTKKQIEEKKAQQGAEASSLKEKENELTHHLELITNIAQRIDNENRALRKKNTELKSEYKA